MQAYNFFKESLVIHIPYLSMADLWMFWAPSNAQTLPELNFVQRLHLRRTSSVFCRISSHGKLCFQFSIVDLFTQVCDLFCFKTSLISSSNIGRTIPLLEMSRSTPKNDLIFSCFGKPYLYYDLVNNCKGRNCA